MQVEKLSGGAIIAHLKPSDFEIFKIPHFHYLICYLTFIAIARILRQAFYAPSHRTKSNSKKEKTDRQENTRKPQIKKKSKELLEEAKRKVEEEIETVENN